jgi:hypothetical protein
MPVGSPGDDAKAMNALDDLKPDEKVLSAHPGLYEVPADRLCYV